MITFNSNEHILLSLFRYLDFYEEEFRKATVRYNLNIIIMQLKYKHTTWTHEVKPS